ncbi:MAG TPA: transketolase C-terminal domain-containing protein, partial [Gemmatimonadales bacterium]|nr:transketolase C-terminal domain-containing protein [Gemmatimonadales bacterium]
AASGKVLNAIAPKIPELIGGSADLTGSNNTEIKGAGVFTATNHAGRNFHFGIREHGMGAAMNGLALHGGFIPFGGTFLIFSDYMRPSIRLAALTHLRVIYVFTHDSIGLGEDGPTHQPVEQLTALRAIPNLTLIRPADPTEVVEAWRAAVTHRIGPVALVLTRQKVAVIDRTKYAAAAGLHQGGYVLADSKDPDVVLVGSGSEVEQVIGAYEQLKAEGKRARAVSMPCLEYFAKQPESYRKSVLPAGVPIVAIEAGSPKSWEGLVGNDGAIIGIERFGASAPYQRIYKEFGLTVDDVVARARDLA